MGFVNRECFQKEGKMSVTINEEDCMGCGTCVQICPEVFGMNELEDKAVVTGESGARAALVDEAAEACPGEAISRCGQ
jgi:ferredoxin